MDAFATPSDAEWCDTSLHKSLLVFALPLWVINGSILCYESFVIRVWRKNRKLQRRVKSRIIWSFRFRAAEGVKFFDEGVKTAVKTFK